MGHLDQPREFRNSRALRQPTIASNITWNVLGLAVNILAGMATMPILVYRLEISKKATIVATQTEFEPAEIDIEP